MLLVASVTDSVVSLCTNVITDLGIAGIFGLMLLESACIPIPAEATMLFAGFGVSQGRFSLLAVVAAGVLGNLAGSWLAYGAGRYGRAWTAPKPGRRESRASRHLAWADEWFARWGAGAVLVCRMLPFVRSFISVPAGLARMGLLRFSLLTTVGCIPFVWLLAAIGEQVGHSWPTLRSSLDYVDYAMIALAAAAAVWLVARRPWARSI